MIKSTTPLARKRDYSAIQTEAEHTPYSMIAQAYLENLHGIDAICNEQLSPGSHSSSSVIVDEGQLMIVLDRREVKPLSGTAIVLAEFDEH